jgi:hypothetical protein
MQLTKEEVQSATPEQARLFLAELIGYMPLLIARAAAPGSDPGTANRLLEIGEAAALLGYRNSKSLYRAAERYPFVVRDGGRLMFSEKGIMEWIAKRTRGEGRYPESVAERRRKLR